MRVHVLGLPYATTKRNEWPFDAYCNKVIRLADMLHDVGHEVYLYAGEDNDARCTEHIPIVTRQEQAQWWPDRKTKVHNDFDVNSPGWLAFTGRTIIEIERRFEKGDVIAVTMGTSHKPICDYFDSEYNSGMRFVETGIGYSGVFAPFRIYESWAWRNYVTGREHMRGSLTDDARFYDDVMPMAYSPDEFTLGNGKGDYALFIGRCIHRKGISIAADAAKRAGVPLVVAGPGVAEHRKGYLRCDDGTEISGDVTYFGIAYPTDRDKLMGQARCLLAPTIYLEPFGGVSVEAQFTGTPVIASNWGAFPENVTPFETGFLCNTLADFTRAIADSVAISKSPGIGKRTQIRKQAIARWSTDTVSRQYDAYLARLQSLDGLGWYA